MTPSPPSIASRLLRRGLMAVASIVALTVVATALATFDREAESHATPTASSTGAARSAETVKDPDRAARIQSLAEVGKWRDLRRATSLVDVTGAQGDLIVVDTALVDTGTVSERARDLEALRRNLDGSARRVVGHLSIGSFEADRPYPRVKAAARFALDPQASTGTASPAFVPFWEREWQDQLFGRPDALLDRMIAGGWDGVYLADADVYRLARPSIADADARMADLIGRIAAYAHRINPSFVIVLGSAEELLAHVVVRGAVDAIAKSDLLFGINGPGEPNDEADIASSLHAVRQALRHGQPVLVTEHVTSDANAAAAAKRLAELGFIADIQGPGPSLRRAGLAKVKY